MRLFRKSCGQLACTVAGPPNPAAAGHALSVPYIGFGATVAAPQAAPCPSGKRVRGFPGWKRFFPSEAQAVATVDRLIDNATILRFSGKGFRQPKEVYGEAVE